MRVLSCHNALQVKDSRKLQPPPMFKFQAVTWFKGLMASLILVPVLAGLSDAQQPTNSDAVFVTFSVTDQYGRYVGGLRREYFSVLEKKEPLDVTFFSQDDKPTSIGIIFDLSGSMSGKSQSITKAVNTFIQQSNTSNDYMIVGFNKKAQLICDWNSSRDDILKALSGVFKYKPNGQTALYDAIYLSLKKMMSSPRAKHVLLIVSDGDDDSSEITRRQILRSLRESDVEVYILGMEGIDSGMGRKNLEDLASVSGGLALFPRSVTELNDMGGQIAEDIRHQYVIGISPTKTVSKDRWHGINIKLTVPKVDPPAKLPRMYVRSREGYYVP